MRRNLASNGKQSDLVCLGIFSGAYGVSGELKIKSFCENPVSIMEYGPLLIEGTLDEIIFEVVARSNETFRVKVEDINDKEKADMLKGKRIYIKRKNLPGLSKDEYYYSDLVGMEVRDALEQVIGTVRNIADYGGGSILEIATNDNFEIKLLSFTKKLVPVVNLKEKYVIIKEN